MDGAGARRSCRRDVIWYPLPRCCECGAASEGSPVPLPCAPGSGGGLASRGAVLAPLRLSPHTTAMTTLVAVPVRIEREMQPSKLRKQTASSITLPLGETGKEETPRFTLCPSKRMETGKETRTWSSSRIAALS